MSSEPCFGHVHRAAARGPEAERPAWGGGEPAPLQIKLRSRGGASARGIGCPSRDAVWAGPTGLRQRPRSGDPREPRAVAARCGAVRCGGPVGVWEPWLGVAEVWPAGSVGGTGRGGRGAGGCRALRGAGEVCGGARSATSPARPPARRAGTRAGKTLPPAEPSRDWGAAGAGGGRPAGRRPSAVCFFSLPAAAAGDEEEDGGAEAERPRPPGVTVAPSGFPAPPPPPRARALRAP